MVNLRGFARRSSEEVRNAIAVRRSEVGVVERLGGEDGPRGNVERFLVDLTDQVGEWLGCPAVAVEALADVEAVGDEGRPVRVVWC